MCVYIFLFFFFPFLQVYRDSNEGERFIQFYHVTSYPYLAVLDPRTGVTKLAKNLIPTLFSWTALLYKPELNLGTKKEHFMQKAV